MSARLSWSRRYQNFMGAEYITLAAPGNSKPERAKLARINNLPARKSVECTAGVVIASAVTYAAFRLHFTLPTISCLYLLMVVLTALRWGIREATAATIAAFLLLDYFFTEPLFSFRMESPANWIALGAFEFVGLVVSHLSVRVRQQASIATEERRNIKRLYDLSRSVLLLDRHEPSGQQIALFIERAIGVQSVALFDASSARTDEAGLALPEVRDLARDAWVQDSDFSGNGEHTWARVLRVETRSIGALAMRGKDLNPLVVDATASIAAIALERSRTLANEARAEAARQSDRLRTAVLDALAHAFKTPLTAIRAASSGLLEVGSLRPPEADLIALIDSESVRLTDLANRLLQTARLDKSDISVCREECRVSSLINGALERLPAGFEGHKVELDVPSGDARIRGNGELIMVALVQLVDNALKYSTPGSHITIGAGVAAREVVISVHNRGPAIGPEDRQCIFDRFYRAPGTEHLAPGTGLGLSITRKIAEAHGGRTWVSSDEKDGTTFFFALPATQGEPS
jgi:two-component system, OmpR family, sensor histidine kinase KdpD